MPIPDHPILQKALEERESLQEQIEVLDFFIKTYMVMADLSDIDAIEVSKTETIPLKRFRLLSMKECLDRAESILTVRGPVANSIDFIKEFEKDGCTVSKNTLAAYLSQKKERFKYDKAAGGWFLIPTLDDMI